MYIIVFVVAISVIVALLFQADVPITGEKLILGTSGYDIVSVDTPVVNGIGLEVFSYITSRTRAGPWIRRLLLNANGVSAIRELASQISFPPMYFPMRRVNRDRLNEVSFEESQEQLKEVLKNGIDQGKYSGTGIGRSIEEYAQYYREGRGTPSEVISRTLNQVKKWEKDNFRMFSELHEDEVLLQARASDARFEAGAAISIFDGVPVAFKDMLCVHGHHSFAGHKDSPSLCSSDDPIVQRLRNLGAIILGVTIQVEGGVTPLGYNAHWQGPVSAFSRNRYSGGSSSGAGVVVASGIVPVAIGFDGGGSVRSPASLSGSHGLAVTFGRIPFGAHLDSVLIKAGPIAATSSDTALTFAALAPNLPNSFYNQLYDGDNHGPPHPTLTGIDSIEDLSDVKLGIYSQWFNDSDPQVRDRCRAVVDFLKSKGAKVVEIEIPHLQAVSMAHGLKISSEFAQGWDRVWGRAPETIEPNTLITLGIGASASSVEILAGEKLRAWMFDYVSKLFEKEGLTAIVSPTIAIEAPILTEATKLKGESNTALSLQVMRFLSWVNFLGLPGYSVPVGTIKPTKLDLNEPSSTVLPVGFQFVGDHWTEHKLLRLGRAVEFGFTKNLEQIKPLFNFDPFTNN